MIRRLQNSQSAWQAGAEFSGKEMTWCFHCKKESLTDCHYTTNYVCRFCVDCGTIFDEDEFLEMSSFGKYAAERAHTIDNLVLIQNVRSKSHRRTLNEGFYVIKVLIDLYGISNVNHATKYYEIAVERRFTRGRKKEHVAAACLYVACQDMKKPFLLIQFSWNVAVSVYALGTMYLQLCKLFSLQDHRLLPRYVAFGRVQQRGTRTIRGRGTTELKNPRYGYDKGPMKDGKVKKVLNTALHLAVSMKEYWIETEREHGGTCAAAIYVSCLLHGYNLSNRNFANLNGLNALLRFLKVKAVHICEATLGKRLIEIENAITTKSESLKVQELIREMQSCKQFANDLKMLGMTEGVCQYKSGAVQSGFGLCKDCYLEYCGGLDGSQPPTFQCAEAETVHTENGNMKDTCTSKDDESDTLSPIDVLEIISYLVDEEEGRLKLIWGHMNPQHTEEEETRQVVARKKEKDKRKRELEAETAAEAAVNQHLNKRLSSKINFDVVAQLFGDEDPDTIKNRDNDRGGDGRKEIANVENDKTLPDDSCHPLWFDFHLEVEYSSPQQLSRTPRFTPKRPPCREQNQALLKNAPITPSCTM